MKNLLTLTCLLLISIFSFGQSNQLESEREESYTHPQHSFSIGIGGGLYAKNEVFLGNYMNSSFCGNLRYTYSPHKNFGIGLSGYLDIVDMDDKKLIEDSESFAETELWEKRTILFEMKFMKSDKHTDFEVFLGIGSGTTVFPNMFIYDNDIFYYETSKKGLAYGGGLGLFYKFNQRLGLGVNVIYINQNIKISNTEYRQDDALFGFVEAHEPLFLNGSIGMKFYF